MNFKQFLISLLSKEIDNPKQITSFHINGTLILCSAIRWLGSHDIRLNILYGVNSYMQKVHGVLVLDEFLFLVTFLP